MLSQRTFKHLFSVWIVSLMLLPSVQASPLFDGTTADAWLIDDRTGQLQGYDLGKWVERYDAGDFAGIVLDSNTAILVNYLQNSSSPMQAGQPSISLTGIGDSAQSVGDKSLGLKLVPEGGSFEKTIAIDMRVNIALLKQGAQVLRWKVGTKPAQSINLNNQNSESAQDGYFSKTFHLVEDDTYNIDVKVLTANGTTVESLSATYVIAAGPNQFRRDTDGDGLPDIVELDIGLDPLSDDWDADTNGDGWTEVDAWLRRFCLNATTRVPVAGDECLDPNGLPIDSDKDNWSDFDEIIRGTNPLDPQPQFTQQPVTQQQTLRYKDYPSVSRLYEVEYQVDSGLLFGPTSSELKWSEVQAVTINGKDLYDTHDLLSLAEIEQSGITPEQISPRLRQATADFALSKNKLPALRLPASDSVVINATHRYHPENKDSFDTSEDYKQIYKVWLSRFSDITPKAMFEEIGEGNWTTAKEWREAFIAYLLPRLTIIRNSNINIESTLPINAIEAVLTKESAFQGQFKTQLFVASSQFGDLQFAKNWESKLRRFGRPDYSLDKSINLITSALKTGKTLASYKTWLQTHFLAGETGSRSDEYIVNKFLSESAPTDLLRQYLFRLVTLPNSRTRIASNTSLVELAVDSDSDGLNNNVEINQSINQLTMPWFNDGDGDLILDGEDDCPHDPLNTCSTNPISPQITLDLDFLITEPAVDADVALVGVRLNQMANIPVTITYQTLLTTSDTATVGEDFTAVTGTVVIEAGQQTALIEVPILSDANNEEGSETFSFQVTHVENAVIADDGVVQITLNDNTVVIPTLDAPLLMDATAQIYTKNTVMTTLSFENNGGGSLTSCVAENLPTGLVIAINGNASSCVISGTPTDIQAITVHTITATNATGSDTATVSIEVKDEATPLIAPSLVSLPLQTFTKGIEITPLRFVNNGGGEITTCDPEVLPSGLSLNITADKKSCEYTGTPTSTQPETEHFLEAHNSIGRSVATVFIKIIDDTSTDTTPPVASQLTPADGSVDVELDTVISLIFSEDMYAQTITNESFTLQSILDENIFSVVNYDENTKKATLTPKSDLILLGTYTANVTPMISDLAGNPLADTLWKFTTRDGQWQSRQQVVEGSTSDIRIARNSSGKVIIVWQQHDGQHFRIWASILTKDGWSEAEKLVDNVEGNAQRPEIVIDKDGNAIVVWQQDEDGRRGIWSNNYTIEKGWNNPKRIDFDNGGGASSPSIVIDGSGNAFAIWSQQDEQFGSSSSIWTNRFVLEDWGSAQILENSSFGGLPQIAMDLSGNILAVWRKWDGDRYSISSQYYSISDGWGDIKEIDKNAGHSYLPKLEINEQGIAVAVWYQDDGVQNIWSNRFDPSIGWGEATLLEQNLTDASQPNITISSTGQALAIWAQKAGQYKNDIWSNNYNSEGWGSAKKLTGNNELNARHSQIAIDNSGNGLAVWSQKDEAGWSIWWNRFNSSSGWSNSQKFVETDEGNEYRPKIRIDNKSGKAVVIWERARIYNGIESNEGSRIESSQFK